METKKPASLRRSTIRPQNTEVIAIQTEEGFLTSDGMPLWSHGTAKPFEGPDAEAQAKAFAARYGYEIVEPTK